MGLVFLLLFVVCCCCCCHCIIPLICCCSSKILAPLCIVTVLFVVVAKHRTGSMEKYFFFCVVLHSSRWLFVGYFFCFGVFLSRQGTKYLTPCSQTFSLQLLLLHFCCPTILGLLCEFVVVVAAKQHITRHRTKGTSSLMLACCCPLPQFLACCGSWFVGGGQQSRLWTIFGQSADSRHWSRLIYGITSLSPPLLPIFTLN